MSTTINIVADKANKTMQWKEEIRTILEETRKRASKTNSLPLWCYPFSQSRCTWVRASRLSHERRGPHCAVWKAVSSIHSPMDLHTRWHIAILTPWLWLLRNFSMSCTSPGHLCWWLQGSAGRGRGKVPHFVWLGLWIGPCMQRLLLKRCCATLCSYYCPRWVSVQNNIFVDSSLRLLNDRPYFALGIYVQWLQRSMRNFFKKLCISKHRVHCSFLMSSAHTKGGLL